MTFNIHPYVRAGADLLNVAGAITGKAGIRNSSGIISVGNNPSPQNLVMTGASFIPDIFGEVAGELGIVYDVGDLVGHWTTNNIMAPMLQAIPKEEGDPVGPGGQVVPVNEECEAYDFC